MDIFKQCGHQNEYLNSCKTTFDVTLIEQLL